MDQKPARTRMAPSPTGRFHLATARIALFDYLLARKTGGQFILRIEDTDQKRFVPGSEEEIVRSLDWLGITLDEGPDAWRPLWSISPDRATRDLSNIMPNYLLRRAMHIPVFAHQNDWIEMRKEQEARKVDRVRYDGTCRAIDPDEAARRIAAGEKYVIRFQDAVRWNNALRMIICAVTSSQKINISMIMFC